MWTWQFELILPILHFIASLLILATYPVCDSAILYTTMGLDIIYLIRWLHLKDDEIWQTKTWILFVIILVWLLGHEIYACVKFNNIAICNYGHLDADWSLFGIILGAYYCLRLLYDGFVQFTKSNIQEEEIFQVL